MNARERWKLAGRVAEKLGCTKRVAHDGITVLREAGLLDRILDGDAEAIALAATLSWYGHRATEPEPDYDEDDGLEQLVKGKSNVDLMFWAVRKC